MNQKSTYYHTFKTNPSIRTAIIYSIDHLFVYTVEIKQGNKSYFIAQNDEPLKFGNMADARRAAIKENAQEAYLALSKTYEEADLSTCHANHQDRYDYNPVVLEKH